MELIVFESEAYYKMIAENSKHTKRAIKEAVNEVLQSLKPKQDDELWVSRDEAMNILRIKSKTTLQKLRDDPDKPIIFSKTGRNICYYKPSLLEHLNNNIVE